MRALAFLRPPALLVLASSAALTACSGEGVRERDGGSFAPVLAGGTFETTSSATSFRAQSPGQESRTGGGQSGGEGNGVVGDSITEDPPRPCACMNAGSLGTVQSISEGCAEVEVTAVAGPPSSVEVGDVLRGRLEPRCRGSAPAAAGDEVLFQYTPGNFSALVVRDGSVRFHFAGKEREASVGELTSPQCWSDQLEILREPGATGAWRADQRREGTDASYESVQCSESDGP